MAYTLASEDLAHVLKHAASAWEGLRSKRIFLTGATGFFGRWLLESIAYANDHLALGCEVWLLVRSPERFALQAPHLAMRADFFQWHGDVQSFAFPPGHFSHVIHAATVSSHYVSSEENVDTVVNGTRHVLAFCQAAGVERLLFVSSGAVYGPQPPDMPTLSETYLGGPDPTSLASAYAESKRMAELLCVIAARQSGFALTLARCFAFVGPYLPLDTHFAIGNFLRDVLAQRDIRILGHGQVVRSYLYAADLAVWLWQILCRGKTGQAYNVGSDQAISLQALADKIRLHATAPVTVHIAEQASPDMPRQAYVPNIDRARADLGLEVRVSLDQAIARTLHWHRTHHLAS